MESLESLIEKHRNRHIQSAEDSNHEIEAQRYRAKANALDELLEDLTRQQREVTVNG